MCIKDKIYIYYSQMTHILFNFVKHFIVTSSNNAVNIVNSKICTGFLFILLWSSVKTECFVNNII